MLQIVADIDDHVADTHAPSLTKKVRIEMLTYTGLNCAPGRCILRIARKDINYSEISKYIEDFLLFWVVYIWKIIIELK